VFIACVIFKLSTKVVSLSTISGEYIIITKAIKKTLIWLPALVGEQRVQDNAFIVYDGNNNLSYCHKKN